MPVIAPVDSIEVAHHARASRFEALDEGRRVGVLEYRLRGPAAVFAHTEVDHPSSPTATALISAAMDLLASRGYSVVALCPRVRAFLADHPEYLSVADPRFLDRPA